MNEQDVSQYELMVLIPPDLKEQDLQKWFHDLRETLSENGGKIVQEDMMGVRDLAYRIRRHDRGFYAAFLFEQNPTNIPEVDRNIRVEMQPLRYLLFKTPKHYFFKTFQEYETEAEAARAKAEQDRLAAEQEKIDQKKSRQKTAAAGAATPEKPEKLEKSEEPEKPLPKTDHTDTEKLDTLLENPDIKI